MAYLFRFDEQSRNLQILARGTITDRSLIEIHSALEKLWVLHCPRSAWFDWSGVTKIEVTRGTIKSLATKSTIVPTGVSRVHIAPHDHTYGLARMFQILSSKTRPNVIVARTTEEAIQLLGLASAKDTNVAS